MLWNLCPLWELVTHTAHTGLSHYAQNNIIDSYKSPCSGHRVTLVCSSYKSEKFLGMSSNRFDISNLQNGHWLPAEG